jgi:hypothetical protein
VRLQDTPQAPPRQFSNKAKPIDRNPLPGAERFRLRRKILDDTKASTRIVLGVLLDDFCWGRSDCFPSNHAIAVKANIDARHVRRILRKLEERGTILCVDDRSLWSRRRIIILAHPNAAAVLDELRKSPFLVARNLGLADTCEGDKSGTCKGDILSSEAYESEKPTIETKTVDASSSEIPLGPAYGQPAHAIAAPAIADAVLDELAAAASRIVADPVAAKSKVAAAAKKFAPVAQKHGHTLDSAWIQAAIGIAERKGKSWSYAIGILSNWSTEGFSPPAKPKTPTGPGYYRPYARSGAPTEPIPPPPGFTSWKEWIVAGCPE